MSGSKNRKVTPIRRFDANSSDPCSSQAGSPSHTYNTRYSLKFFTKANPEPRISHVLEEYRRTNNQRDAARITTMNPQNRELENIRLTNRTRNPRKKILPKFFACFAFFALISGVLVFSFIFAYARDRFETAVKNEIGSLADKVYGLEDKLFLINDVLKHISIGITQMQESQVSQNNVKSVVLNQIQQYDADKTGRIDFALESAGGEIITTRETQPYKHPSYNSLLGLPFCTEKNVAQSLIQASSSPGECWAFKGSKGNVVIKLLGHVHVTGVSMEHIPRSINPTGENSSAPNKFTVYGLTSKDDTSTNYFLGTFSYDIEGPTLQYFEVQKTCSRSFLFLELIIESNHGNDEYTCVYRLRVHGKLDSNADKNY